MPARPLTSHSLEIVSRLWQTELRVEAVTFNGAAVGDELVLTLDGTPAVVAMVVRTVGQRYGHEYLAAEPLVTQELRAHVDRLVGPLNLDRMTPSGIAGMLVSPVTVQGALDAPLERWTTRERPVAWAWRSLLRGVAAATGEEVSWRHDARGNRMVVEADRADWPEVALPPALQRNDHWTVYPGSPVQAGDRGGRAAGGVRADSAEPAGASDQRADGGGVRRRRKLLELRTPYLVGINESGIKLYSATALLTIGDSEE